MAKPFTNFASPDRRGTYEFAPSPEQKANSALRYQKKVADTMTRAREESDRFIRLKAKAGTVPEEVLPAGGVHKNMSPADMDAAESRIDRFHQENRTGQRDTRQPYQPAGQDEIIRTPGGGTMSGHANRAPQGPQEGDTRRSATGATETLVHSQSGPRWVASVANPPPAGNSQQQERPEPRQFVDHRAVVDNASGQSFDSLLAANRRLASPGGATEPIRPKTYQPGDFQGNPADFAAAGTGRNIAGGPLGYGTAYSTGGAQTRPVAGIAPAGAHNDINTGGRPPMVAATAPVSTPTNSPVVPPAVTPVATPVVPPVVAQPPSGAAARSAAVAATNPFAAPLDPPSPAANRFKEWFVHGNTSAPPDTAERTASPDAASAARKAAMGAQPPAPVPPTPVNPVASPVRQGPTYGGPSGAPAQPAPMPPSTTKVDDDEEERKRRMAGRQPFQYA